MLPMIRCARCDADGRLADGSTCSWCNGQSVIVSMCELCKIEYATGYDSEGTPVCSTCEATTARNDAA